MIFLYLQKVIVRVGGGKILKVLEEFCMLPAARSWEYVNNLVGICQQFGGNMSTIARLEKLLLYKMSHKKLFSMITRVIHFCILLFYKL